MYTLISIPAGMILEAVIVENTGDRMRVIAPGFSDTLELRRGDEGWVMDGGDRVEFEFLADTTAADNAVAAPAVKVRTAGSN